MPRASVSYTDLTHRVLRESPEPLPFAEIMAHVEAIAPITTKNPKQTIRNAITSSPLLISTGNGRYGWKPRLLNGARLRLPLDAPALASDFLAYSDEARDALYPAFFGPSSYDDRSPVAVALPDGRATQLTLRHAGARTWGSDVSPELKAWLDHGGAQAGDDLLLEVIDGVARQYRLELQRQAERDEVAIAERNAQAVAQTLKLASAHNRNHPIFMLVSPLLAHGLYHHPIPPDPLHTLLALDEYGGVLGDRSVLSGLEDDADATLPGSARMGGLGGEFPGLADLPPEYQPGPNRRPRPSAAASCGPASVVTLRVTHRDRPNVWRDIAIAEDQTLEDLHLAIQAAYDWADDHLYSFYLSGRPYDRNTEVGSPFSEASRFTHRVSIGSLKLVPGRRFLYLFDYGDDHAFDVEVLTRDEAAPQGTYPRVVAKHGRAPSQYGSWRF